MTTGTQDSDGFPATVTAKASPIGADILMVADSAANNVLKKSTITQVLSNAGLATPVTVPNGGTGVGTLTTAYGTLCAGTTATGTVQTVSPGSAGNPLVSGGASALPSYTGLGVGGGGTGVATMTTAYAPVCAGTTATGALQVASTGLSSSGYILTSNGASALPSFQAAGASGALIKLATATAASSSTIDFSNNLSSTYDNYVVTVENLIAGTGGAVFQARIGTGAGPTYQTSSYSGQIFTESGAPAPISQTSGTSAMDLMNNVLGLNSTSTRVGGGVYYLYNVNNSSNDKVFIGIANLSLNGTGIVDAFHFPADRWQGATVLTSLRFLMSSGNIATGVFKLYGIAN